MKKRFLLLGMALIGLATFSETASAAPGYVSRPVNLRAGPGSNYPVITKISSRSGLEIYGCTDGWKWCDISTGNLRGWISGRYLNSDYQNRRIGIIQGGPNIGVPVIVFNQDEYWNHYYHDQPFYRDYHPQGGPPPRDHAPDRDFHHDDRHDDDRHDDHRRDDGRYGR